jgi:glutathione S-transferase
MKLLYFPILARNVLAEVLAKDKQIALDVAAPDWPKYKPDTLFGQLPQLECELAGKCCQSMAIARLLARRANALGETEQDFMQSEMLLEKFVELYDCLFASNVYGVGTPFDKVETTRISLQQHLAHMETMVDASRGTVGDIACVCAVLIASKFGVGEITKHAPKVLAYYESKKEILDAACGSYEAWFKPVTEAAN